MAKMPPFDPDVLKGKLTTLMNARLEASQDEALWEQRVPEDVLEQLLDHGTPQQQTTVAEEIDRRHQMLEDGDIRSYQVQRFEVLYLSADLDPFDPFITMDRDPSAPPLEPSDIHDIDLDF